MSEERRELELRKGQKFAFLGAWQFEVIDVRGGIAWVDAEKILLPNIPPQDGFCPDCKKPEPHDMPQCIDSLNRRIASAQEQIEALGGKWMEARAQLNRVLEAEGMGKVLEAQPDFVERLHEIHEAREERLRGRVDGYQQHIADLSGQREQLREDLETAMAGWRAAGDGRRKPVDLELMRMIEQRHPELFGEETSDEW